MFRFSDLSLSFKPQLPDLGITDTEYAALAAKGYDPVLEQQLIAIGASYVNDELVLERSHYNGEQIKQPQRQLTPEQQWEILNTQPIFTGHCPKCGYQFPSHVPELVHFDCTSCGWIDDSV